MFRRLSSFLLVLLAGAGIGWFASGLAGALAGVFAGAMVWFFTDLVRGRRVIMWLRDPQAREAPTLWGLWGEAADRSRRLLRARDQQLIESEARLQAFLAAIQASPNGVAILDGQGYIEWFNQTAAKDFGLDPQRDLGQQIGNLVRDPVFAGYYAGRDYGHEVLLAGRGGTPQRPVQLSVQLHPYGDGRLLLLSRDVTALAQAEAMRRDFVANVSHEIRTPLTVLSGFIETLQSLELDPSERERYLGLMAAQAERMQTLVQDLLTLSRLEGSPPPGFSDWITAQELCLQCVEEGRALSALLWPEPAAPQQLHLHAVAAISLAGSSSELRSALSNLVSNAVRYTPAGGQIDITAQILSDGRVEFAVTDTGPGIAPEHLPRLSERFYRVDRSRSRESGGTGLGLAIAKHVAQRHDGELSMSSVLGQGSRFSMILPVNRFRQAAAGGQCGATRAP
jgi:two-component system phosphate regulon sensor histidine kinase PhoR